MTRYILLVLFLPVVLVASAQGQVRFRVAAGLSTDWITNDNPAAQWMVTGGNDVPEEEAVFGGGFDGAQMGWGLRAYADLDKQKKFRVPLGFDYFTYSGTQTIKSERFNVRVTHSNELYTCFTGFEWSFIEFPWAFARAYIGAEARVLIVGENTISSTRNVLVGDTLQTTSGSYNGKPSATRLGALARLGIEGEVYYPVFINTSVGWGAMNLIGRDETPTAEGGRGELLTPVSRNEPAESIVYHLNFTFMVQVRL
ncbi:MAG: hypothetical protein IPH85_00295 [Ignavibacteria bacterium]|nr:hypothetical protein [Ignavibacteria bacterium]MBP7092919.1 hypothetical protein [Candidatus Kapabacteria bacterium]MBK6759474.1 hypothetical protein [Ignavibacteria bacterium]MBK7033345.1 hypothetical protein [Ignavibacteria bacterium]MBK7184364.1 hypothetical protein [Ignavibacteria bacterium]